MSESFLFDVFLSHSAKDKAVVRPIAERLRDDGLKVWFDEWVLKPGDHIQAKIVEGLECSRVLVLCMSANAFGSDWTQLETGTFRFRDPQNKDHRFIPLRLDTSSIKNSLAPFLYIDWLSASCEQEYAKLLAACWPETSQLLSEQQQTHRQFLEKIGSLGHTHFIWSVAWSPDGQHALSGSEDKTLRLWDIETGRCQRVFEGHRDGVLSVAWSPDGQRALSSSGDNTLRLWEIKTGRCLRVFEGHTNSVWSVAWSPDGQRALSGSQDKMLLLWDIETGRCQRVFEGHTDRVQSVAWSPDGQQALSGSQDKTLRLWNIETGACQLVFEGYTNIILSVAWSPGGQWVLCGGVDKMLRLWDIETGRCQRVFEGHTSSVLSVAWSPDGRYALSGSRDKTLRLWDIQTGRCQRVFEGHTDRVQSVAWSPDGQRAFSGDQDKTLRLWDIETGRCQRVFEGHTDRVLSVVWSSDRQRALSGSADNTVRLWDVETWRCQRVFEGHTNSVLSVAWSPDGQRALSGSGDNTLRLWDIETGRCQRVFEGHTNSVLSVAWSPDGRWALSGSQDKTLQLWDVETGRCQRVFEGHTNSVWSVALSPDGWQALSSSGDNTLRLWDIETGRCQRVFEGHVNYVLSVAWSPDGRRALSCSRDNTLRLWDIETGRCQRVLEGHVNYVWSVAWSPDGRRALSGSQDKTLRLWDIETGECQQVFEGHTESVLSVAWNLDGQHALSSAVNGVVRCWRVELSNVDGSSNAAKVLEQVQYTNAKVLLVGDTGVGKSGLAERLIRNEFVPTKSSHARKVHVLDTQVLPTAGGVALHRETMLWDLAGQPAYRLVHQLSLEDAALACVLFDNRNETNPFEGAAYWSQVLDQARTNTNMKKILVASRTDVGGLPASRERIESFACDHGFAAFIPTSASTGGGCEALLEAIRSLIPWEELPTVTTEGPLAPLRAYIGALKGEKDGLTAISTKLFTVGQLHEGFSADYGRKLPLDEFIAHLKRLEDTDAVDVLVFHSTGAKPGPETLVLLDPTREDAYASALLVAAKDEPDGPGHLLESRVREGQFILGQDERLADPESEKHVLWFVLEYLLSHDLALRETIKGNDYIVFPSQCTAELRFPGVAVFGVTFGFAGPVRNIYAVLIAQLAHFEGFKKREFFHEAAAYRPDAGGRCIARLRDHGRGQAELQLSFEADTPQEVRQGFIEFVGTFLESKSTLGSVTKRYAYLCENEKCRKPFDDTVVQVRLVARKRQLVCPYCDKKTPLVDLLAIPTVATKSVATRISTDATAGRRRMTAALVIKAKEAEGTFDVFLSHNAKDKAAVEKIAKRLSAVGIRPWFDKWNLAPGDTVSDALEKAIKTVSCAALCFGPADVGKWHIMEIRAYVSKWASGNARMIPMILPGVKEQPELPLFVGQTLWVDMRDWENVKDDGFYRLVCGILGKEPGDSPKRKFSARDVAEWQGVEL